MFFHTLLLQPQHKMQLNLPWIAATLGVKKLKKEDIINCNIVKICDYILIFIESESLNPSKRFSLRLSAILISGVSQIFRQQVIFLRDDIDRELVARERAADRLLTALNDEDETPPTPKPTVRKKRAKQKEPETQDSLEQRFPPLVPRGREEKTAEPEFTLEPLRIPEVTAEEAGIQIRVEDITLREEDARPTEPQLMDDFGPMEEIPVPITSTTAEQITVVADVHVPLASPKKKYGEPIPEEKPADEPQIPVEEIQVEEVVLVLPSEKEPDIQIEVVPPPEKEPDIQVDVVSPPEKEPAIQVVPEAEIFVAPLPKKAPTKEGDKNIIVARLLRKKKKKFVFINQQMQIYQDELELVPVVKTVQDFKPMAKFWPEWETMYLEGEAARPARDTGSTRPSAVTEGSIDVDKTAATPEVHLGSMPLAQQIETPSDVTTPKKRPHPCEETVEEVMPPAANGLRKPPEILPRKRRKVVSIEEVQAAEQPTKEGVPEEDIAILQEPPEIQPLTVEEGIKSPERIPRDREGEVTPPRSGYKQDTFGLKWTKRIMEVVYQYDKIGPANICRGINEELTKLNMSIVFATLLTLAKDQFVELIEAEDSIELEFVEKGPKDFVF